MHDAVAHFNMGSRAAVEMLKQDGLVPGYYFEECVGKSDKKRVKKADHRAKLENLSPNTVIHVVYPDGESFEKENNGDHAVLNC